MTRFLLLARACAGAAAIALAGCAAPNAYKEGQLLVAEGRMLEGLSKFEEASRIDPGVAQYRIAAIQTRDRWLIAQIEQAEAQRRQGRLDEAEQTYHSVLALQAGNARGLAGLRSIEQQRQAQVLLNEAEQAIVRKDLDTARARLNAILLDNPSHEAARRRLQKLDEKPVKPAPETVLAAAYKKPITIEFKDAALRSVFEVISRSSGLNFLFDKDVRADQKTSIYLKNSTIETAVNLTLLTNQLAQRVLDGNTILVYPNTQAKQREYQPLTVKSFYLANAEAKTVAATLKTLLKSRDVVVDDKLNLVIVRDSAEAIRLAEKLVALHDVPESEVMLEVEILEVKRTRLLDLGIRWPDQLSLSPLPSLSGNALTVADLRGLNSSRIAATLGSVTLSAKNVNTDANILANPRIRVRNREKAKILIGERVPNITTTSTSTGFVAESVTYVDVGLKLDVEPTIYLDDEVAIKISLEVSNIIRELQTKSGSIAYQIGTRTAQTVLRLKDGENQVLAGLINDEDRRTANKVPGLGEVPVVGRLFGNQSDDGSKTEIVLSITPRILRNIRRPDAAILEFESGTESSLGARPGPAVATPVAAAIAPARPPPPATADRASTPPVDAGTQQVNAAQPGMSSSPPTITAVSPVLSGSAAVLRWQGPTQLKVGDTFALQLLMQSDQPVVSIPMALAFNPQALQVTSVAEGDFLRQGGAQTAFTSRVDPNGQVLLTGTRTGDTGASAVGAIATVNFRVMAAPAPETQVQLLMAAPIGLGGRSIAVPLPPPHAIVIGTN